MTVRQMSIRGRIVVMVAAVVTMVVGLLGALTYIGIRNQLHDDLRLRAISFCQLLGNGVASGLDFSDSAVVAEVVDGVFRTQRDVKEIWIADAGGNLFYRNLRDEIEPDEWDTLRTTAQTLLLEDPTCLVVGEPVTLRERSVGTAWLRIGKESMLAGVKEIFPIIVLGGSLLLALLIWPIVVFSRRIVNPLRTFESAALRVSEGITNTPIETTEIGQDFVALGRAFNRMQRSLGETIEALTATRGDLEDRVRRRTAQLEIEVAERKRAEETTRDREGLLKATLEATGDGLLVVNNSGQATHWNVSFLSLWRIPDNIIATRDDKQLLGFVLSQLKDPAAFLDKVTALYMSADESFDLIEFADGRAFERYSRPLVRDGSILGRVWSFRDITARRQAEMEQLKLRDQLERAERMESLGLLAGGVAHDLNNTLGPVVGYSELLVRELPIDSRAAVRASKIGKAAEDAAVVIQDLLTLARRGRCELNPIDFNRIINSYLESPSFEKLRSRHPEVNVSVQLAANAGTILGSEPHLSKVIMNLVTNAFEAMSSGGELIIRSERARIHRLVGGYANIEPGEYAIFSAKDTGPGIAKEDISRIFEPYFSKKKMGQSGSGLGLAVVYGIVKDHHGYYDIKSELGKGTEFILYFPIADESQIQPASISDDDIRGGHETILVVDDMLEQREMATEILTMLGYAVHAVASGQAAIDFTRKMQVDLIMLDMIMEPGIDGLDTYREILKRYPRQRAIVASGFSATDRVEGVLALGASQFVRKPYNIPTLAKAVRAALDGAPHRADGSQIERPSPSGQGTDIHKLQIG